MFWTMIVEMTRAKLKIAFESVKTINLWFSINIFKIPFNVCFLWHIHDFIVYN